MDYEGNNNLNATFAIKMNDLELPDFGSKNEFFCTLKLKNDDIPSIQK